MRKLHIIALAAMAMATLATSCSDDWKEEQYTQMVSLKAPRNSDGVTNIYIRYQADGSGQYKLPVLISGSTPSTSNLDVKVGVDNDTLQVFNVWRFNDRTDLFYKQLSSDHFSLGDGMCRIPSGSTEATIPINFDFKGLDLVDNYVLPIKVEPSASYTINNYKGWDKALLNINLFNDYSGTYSATTVLVNYAGNSGVPSFATTRTVKVVDANTVFFYAGTVWEQDPDRALYKINAKFENGGKDGTGKTTGTLTLTAGDAQNRINFATTGNCTYEIEESMDKQKPYLKHYYVRMTLHYKYQDITMNPNKPIDVNVNGTMVMERQLNTLIPDEDQAIQW